MPRNFLLKKKALPKSKLPRLTCKVDLDSLPRRDGLLRFTENLPTIRYLIPIILQRGNWLTTLIAWLYCEDGHHVTETNHTLAILSIKHRIVAAREKTREWENAYNECSKL